MQDGANATLQSVNSDTLFSAETVTADSLKVKALAGEDLTREEAQAILEWPEEGLLELLNAAYTVRRNFFGKKVKLNFLLNIQSGICPEDCGYCSQSRVSDAPVDKYRLMGADQVLAAAERAVANKAQRLCMVASMRGPSDKDVASVAEAVRQVRATYPQLELCACLGLLGQGQAETLEAAGVDAYNHNLNTSERHYGEVCSTHGFSDRLDTVRKSREAGMQSCSGALFGMGETQADVLDVAFRLRDLGVDSIPVNFLVPVEGTPFQDKQDLTPTYCLKILCLFRLLCPRAELRVAGGRELHLRSLQAMTLYCATSLFVGDYLTTEGQAPLLDLEMIRDLGFEVLGEGEMPLQKSEPLKDRVRVTHSHRAAALSV